jgi:hypothetical protein
MRLLVFVVMCMKSMWMSIRDITLFRVLRGEGVLAMYLEASSKLSSHYTCIIFLRQSGIDIKPKRAAIILPLRFPIRTIQHRQLQVHNGPETRFESCRPSCCNAEDLQTEPIGVT